MTTFDFMARLAPYKAMQIENITSDILAGAYGSLDSVRLPVSLPKILSKYNNIEVLSAKFAEPDISGALEKNDDKQIKILVSKFDSKKRQIFSAAHEIGHLELHPDLNVDIYRRMKKASLSPERMQQEDEADWFAGALLMPSAVLKNAFILTKRIDELAIMFGVSELAMKTRISCLLYLQAAQ